MPEPRYPEVPNRIDLPAVERRLLNRWNDERTFERSVDQRSDAEFVFYDGPPFANGLPHYGHLLTGYVKDVVPRYQTMRGRRVERRFGWDCHGLPAEMVAEQELGVSGHARIAEFGIDRFNDHCRTSVLRYTDEWERYVSRQARWVDFDDDYKTMDLSYMESVIWAFEQLWNRGLIYEAYRVMPYSWGAETPLSNFEIRLPPALARIRRSPWRSRSKMTGRQPCRQSSATGRRSSGRGPPHRGRFRPTSPSLWETTSITTWWRRPRVRGRDTG